MSETQKKKHFISTPMFDVLMIVLGLAVGYFDVPILKPFGLLVSELFIRIFKCISLPIISLSIIVTLANYCFKGMLRHVWRRTMIYTLSTTLFAAGLSCGLYVLIAPSAVHVLGDPNMKQSALLGAGYLSYLAKLVPDNIYAPFLNNQVISVLFLGIVIGLAIRFIPEDEPRETITHFFKGMHGLFMVITRWVIKMIPLGVFGFMTAIMVQFRSGAVLHGLGKYLLVIVLANLIQGFLILPLWLKSKNIAPFQMMKLMMPALSLAFFSKSSVGTLPVTMNTAEDKLGIRPSISRFVLPLCTSINMNGCAAFIFTTVIYLMQNHGVPVSFSAMLIWVVIATVAAIGNAGVPMGCFFLSMSLLASMNVPITLMGLILPFYTLIDMLETALNVWSDACVAKVVDQDMSEWPIENEAADLA